MRAISFFLAVLVLGATAVASAQVAPGTDPSETAAAPAGRHERRAPNAVLPLNMAYRQIGNAEALGARGSYFDSAKTHYRSAMARYAKGDMTGAFAEARAASDLARAALAERPAPVPKDLPAPPKPTLALMSGPGSGRGFGGAGGPEGGPAGWGGPGRGGPQGGPPRNGPPEGGRPFIGRGQVDAAQLGELVKIENTAEARSLADAAVNANAASQRAALAGDLEEAGRQRMLGWSLASAVRNIALADHPDLMGPSRGPRTAPAPSAS